ncbi:MAG: helix-turn-helix transcriptional regulator [Actinomycetota bacterium]|nr:helix-turn-helix transcriptional regulator [Actinomycetota bacterium]
MKISQKTLSSKSSTQQKVVAKELRKLRIKSDLSQDELATRAGIDRKTINRIENGHFSPTLDTITRLSLVLRITPGTLLGSGRRTKK